VSRGLSEKEFIWKLIERLADIGEFESAEKTYERYKHLLQGKRKVRK